MRGPLLLILALSTASLFAAAACGGPGPAATPAPTREPLTEAEVLARSGELMASLTSFRYEMIHEVGTTAFLPGLEIEKTLGDVQTPDRLYSEFSGLFGDIPISAKLIALSDRNFMTNPLTGKWQEIDAAVSPIGFFNPKQGISSMMSQVTDARFVASGPSVYRLTGRMPAASLEPLMGATVENGVVDVELEIDADSLHLKMARFLGQVNPTDTPETIRVVTLSRFNEPVNIEAPDIP